MGFGMKKSVYTRRPKKVFAKLKSVYGEELKKRANDSFSPSGTLTLEEKEKIKLKITQDLKAGKLKTIKVIFISVVLLITVPASIAYLYTTFNKTYYPNWQHKMNVEVFKNGLTIQHHYYENGSIKMDIHINSTGETTLISHFSNGANYNFLKPNK